MYMEKNLIIKAVMIAVFLIVRFTPAHAAAILDGTMQQGTAGILLSGDFEIKAEYGKTAGGNLFHSFSEFNIDQGESAVFTGPATVQNIISRVTGGNVSTIDGTLRSTISNANLYFFNPSGVIFGANAKLDLKGSFYVATADYLIMENGDTFYANAEDPVLSVSNPAGFGFIDGDIDGISLTEQAQLKVDTGQTLSLTGGNIDIKQSQVAASEGRIDIISTASAGEILRSDNDINLSPGMKRGDITITNHSTINVNGDRSGDVFLIGGALYITDSTIQARTQGNQMGGKISIDVDSMNASDYTQILSENISFVDDDTPKPESKGGDVIISASESVDFSEGSSIITSATADGGQDINCRAGHVEINARSVSFSDYAAIQSRSDEAGRGGDVAITATEDVVFDNSVVFSDTNSGDAGNISIEAENVSFANGAGPATQTSGSGKGGNISIIASESVTLFGTDEQGYASTVTSYSKTENSGHAGDIRIEAKTVSFKDGGKIIASTKGRGDGGEISIQAIDIELAGVNPYGENEDGLASGLASRSEMVDVEDAGKAGNIEIETDSLVLSDGAQITNSTKGGGESGAIQINSNTMRISGVPARNNSPSELLPGGIYSRSESGMPYSKQGGQIALTAANMTLTDRGTISSSSTGGRNAGDIRLTTHQLILSDDASIESASTSPDHSAAAGSIEIASNNIKMDGGSSITTESSGAGPAGNIKLSVNHLRLDTSASISSASTKIENGGPAGRITITAADSIQLANNSSFTTEAINTAADDTTDKDNGKIIINAKNRLYLTDSKITTSVQGGTGNGGDIEIDPEFVILDKSKIIANAYEGNGGNIHIVADYFIQSNDSLVDASSQLGIDGTINIEAPDVDVSSGLIVLPTNFLEVTKWLKTPCAQQTDEDQSRFVIHIQQTVPMAIDSWLPYSSTAYDTTPIK